MAEIGGRAWFGWCFSHGRLHPQPGLVPAEWVPLTGSRRTKRLTTRRTPVRRGASSFTSCLRGRRSRWSGVATTTGVDVLRTTVVGSMSLDARFPRHLLVAGEDGAALLGAEHRVDVGESVRGEPFDLVDEPFWAADAVE